MLNAIINFCQQLIEKLTKEIEVAEREQDKLFATGNPFELGSKARAAKEDLEKLSQEEGKLADMHNKLQTAYDGVNDKINEYSQKADEATASTSRLSRIGGMVGKAIGSIATFGKNAAKSLTGAKKSSSGFGLSLGTLVKYGFGIRSLYVLVNKLRSALVDGFKNLSQYSGETNGSISMLWSSLERLKNSLASKLFITLTEGCGYDKICTFASVPARKTDYQAYLRKALKILNDMLLLKNMPADFPAEKI